jgi:hypothetical protein
MNDLQLLLYLFYGFQYTKECLSVSFASKDGWGLMFSDRHCGLLLSGHLLHTHTINTFIYIYIYRGTQLQGQMGVTKEFFMSMRH